ncbi:MAG TPA: tol-pal system protein YbgF [Aliiroseovarius sp.]|nr:tol-pal system protein YbgF [Aliiroseovarius sp.]
MNAFKAFAGAALALTITSFAMPALSQDRAESLADIRQELSVLYVEIQQLKTELSTTGAPSGSGGTGSVLDRVNAIEAALTGLIARTETLEHRVDQIVRDGTNRIGDLEFRLVELEGGDVSQLGQTTTLGGGPAPTGPVTPPVENSGGGQMAVGEQADFNAAEAALNNGNFADAAARFANFTETYPGGPLSAQAHYLRGEALAGLGQTAQAARAYLTSFSGDPNGPRAPDALFKLGAALGDLGQTSEACVTLAEVGARFPAAATVSMAESKRQALGCN